MRTTSRICLAISSHTKMKQYNKIFSRIATNTKVYAVGIADRLGRPCSRFRRDVTSWPHVLDMMSTRQQLLSMLSQIPLSVSQGQIV